MTVTEFLHAHVPFLSGLSQEQAHALALEVDQRGFEAGSTVLFKGTTVEGLYVIATGKVAVWAQEGKSKKLSQVAELGPGQVFGETSIMEKTTAGATIKAAEGGTLIFLIPQEAFQGVLAEHPDFQGRVSALMAERKKKGAKPATPPAAA